MRRGEVVRSGGRVERFAERSLDRHSCDQVRQQPGAGQSRIGGLQGGKSAEALQSFEVKFDLPAQPIQPHHRVCAGPLGRQRGQQHHEAGGAHAARIGPVLFATGFAAQPLVLPRTVLPLWPRHTACSRTAAPSSHSAASRSKRAPDASCGTTDCQPMRVMKSAPLTCACAKLRSRAKPRSCTAAGTPRHRHRGAIHQAEPQVPFAGHRAAAGGQQLRQHFSQEPAGIARPVQQGDVAHTGNAGLGRKTRDTAQRQPAGVIQQKRDAAGPLRCARLDGAAKRGAAARWPRCPSRRQCAG